MAPSVTAWYTTEATTEATKGAKKIPVTGAVTESAIGVAPAQKVACKGVEDSSVKKGGDRATTLAARGAAIEVDKSCSEKSGSNCSEKGEGICGKNDGERCCEKGRKKNGDNGGDRVGERGGDNDGDRSENKGSGSCGDRCGEDRCT